MGLQIARTEGENSWEGPTLGRPSVWVGLTSGFGVLAWKLDGRNSTTFKAGSGEGEHEGSLEPEALLGLVSVQAWDLPDL